VDKCPRFFDGHWPRWRSATFDTVTRFISRNSNGIRGMPETIDTRTGSPSRPHNPAFSTNVRSNYFKDPIEANPRG
jgi:hypothetical protein